MIENLRSLNPVKESFKQWKAVATALQDVKGEIDNSLEEKQELAL